MNSRNWNSAFSPTNGKVIFSSRIQGSSEGEAIAYSRYFIVTISLFRASRSLSVHLMRLLHSCDSPAPLFRVPVEKYEIGGSRIRTIHCMPSINVIFLTRLKSPAVKLCETAHSTPLRCDEASCCRVGAGTLARTKSSRVRYAAWYRGSSDQLSLPRGAVSMVGTLNLNPEGRIRTERSWNNAGRNYETQPIYLPIILRDLEIILHKIL